RNATAAKSSQSLAQFLLFLHAIVTLCGVGRQFDMTRQYCNPPYRLSHQTFRLHTAQALQIIRMRLPRSGLQHRFCDFPSRGKPLTRRTAARKGMAALREMLVPDETACKRKLLLGC